jgi:O-antigen biosynthesis protein
MHLLVEAPAAVAKAPPAVVPVLGRPVVRGKFLFSGDTKVYVKGVTYGAFKADENGNEYTDLTTIDRDFAQMADAGINTVRIPHTAPPRALLDLAHRYGLWVMVGLSAEQFVGHLIDRNKKCPDIDAIIGEKVAQVAGHPALLCYAIGNEIGAPQVRWLGSRRIERFLHRIYRNVKSVDPHGLVTYVNYPTTEYLQLPFLDLVCFNVYLERQETLRSYLLRLHNIAGDRPLIMSELGLDAMRHGEQKQAQVLDWQIRTSFAVGCAGVIVFAWTDEWFRGDEAVEDWAFGLTDWERRPKPALRSVSRAFAEIPFPLCRTTPKISVVICTYNGAETIRSCLSALARQSYRNFEVIVVNDGSTDATAKIADEYDARVITTHNHGLSAARNLGWQAATGEYVAYIDDDAYPDVHWLEYLVGAFTASNHVAIGGPNVEPLESGNVARCVANAPGGPIHVLLTDELAEHIPGCNMAIRRWALKAIGGFDPLFRVAGDDVDLCWRLQERDWTLGFSPAAVVWHHQRTSVRAYWKQQRGYGRAEALLELKWPIKYNVVGHHTLSGRIYGKGFGHLVGLRSRIYHGVWGTAPFQSLYERSAGTTASLPTMPEWHLFIWFLAACSLLSLAWRPLIAAIPLLCLAIWISFAQAYRGAIHASFTPPAESQYQDMKLRAMTAWLHFIQPIARLIGRIEYGLVFWRNSTCAKFLFRRFYQHAEWTSEPKPAEQRLASIEAALLAQRAVVLRSDAFARWDMEVRGGTFGAARLLMAVEEHGSGAQYVRVGIWPRCRAPALLPGVVFLLLSLAAALSRAGVAALVFTAIEALIVTWVVRQAGCAMGALATAATAAGVDKP